MMESTIHQMLGALHYKPGFEALILKDFPVFVRCQELHRVATVNQ